MLDVRETSTYFYLLALATLKMFLLTGPCFTVETSACFYLLAPVLDVRMVKEKLQRVKVSDKDLVQAECVHVQDALPAIRPM